MDTLPFTNAKYAKGLFINDVINFGGYRDPPLPLVIIPLVIIRHFLATPPLVRVTLDNTVFATKHRMLGS